MCLGIPGKIISIDNEPGVFKNALIDFGGVTKTVNISLTPDIKVGEYSLVHAGIALSIINESEANKIINLLESLEETQHKDLEK